MYCLRRGGTIPPPEHPRSIGRDKGQKNGGLSAWVYNAGYTRAMMQAPLMKVRK